MLPVAAKEADKPLTDPAGLEGLSTVILTASQHHHSIDIGRAAQVRQRETGDIMQPSSYHGDPHQRQFNRCPEEWTFCNIQ